MGGLMRTYGGRRIKREVLRQMDDRKELRDAIVFSVNSTLKYCMVKIQGSNTQIKAYYPENWESTPQYLKPGNAVRISHPGGNKARIEIVGHGFLIPTAIVGGTVTPTPIVPGDTVLTGCTLAPTDPVSMSAIVQPGTFRIDGVTYSLSGMLMDRSDVEMDRGDLFMNSVGDSVTFDAASAYFYRYDSVVVGTDGDAHIVKGADFSATTVPLPSPPAAPADHVRVGWVLIYPNMTTIATGDLNRLYTTPMASELRVVVEDQDLDWGDTTTTLTISVRDQYGNTIFFGGAGYQVTIAWTYGNGTLAAGGASQDESAPFSFSMAYTEVVSYTRDGNDPGDKSPTFAITESVTGLSNATYIVLRDAIGAMMF
jgi:hypothetical protein